MERLHFFTYQNPKSLCFSHSLQNSFIHAYLLEAYSPTKNFGSV